MTQARARPASGKRKKRRGVVKHTQFFFLIAASPQMMLCGTRRRRSEVKTNEIKICDGMEHSTPGKTPPRKHGVESGIRTRATRVKNQWPIRQPCSLIQPFSQGFGLFRWTEPWLSFVLLCHQTNLDFATKGSSVGLSLQWRQNTKDHPLLQYTSRSPVPVSTLGCQCLDTYVEQNNISGKVPWCSVS